MAIESNKNDSNVWKVSLVSSPEFIPSFEEVFFSHNHETIPSITIFEIDGEKKKRLMEVYLTEEPDHTLLADAILNIASINNIPAPDLKIEQLNDVDWVSHSQKILKPIDAGKFYLFGDHDRDTIPENRIPILMEAGQAFGTGSHETTMGCLMALNDLSEKIRPRTALDLGCGSGILSIAMAKLWDSKIIASDIDPIATQTANDNLSANNVEKIDYDDDRHGVAIITCDGFDDERMTLSEPYDLIVANILAKPLKILAHDIIKNLNVGCFVILSGLLKIQADEILDVYTAGGLELAKMFPINEWQTLLLRKK